MEARAFAWLAINADFASHQRHQSTANRQSKAGAAVLPRSRAVELGELFENMLLGVLRDADAGVLHADAQMAMSGGFFVQAGAHQHLALLGEFGGVVDQVADDLTQAEGVAAQAATDLGRQIGDEFEIFFLRRAGEHRQRVLEQVAKLELHRLEFEVTRFDFREIENVVDDAKQVAAGALDGLGEMALVAAESAVEKQFGHAEHTVHRRADLVAHGGEEIALGLAGGFSGVLGAAQLLRARGDLVLEMIAVDGEARIALCDLAEHAIEAAGERVDFLDLARLGTRGVVLTVGDTLHERGQGRQRLQGRAVQTLEHHRGEQEREGGSDRGDRAVGEYLQVKRAQVEGKVEHAHDVATFDDRLGHAQRVEAEVRVFSGQTGCLRVCADEISIARELHAAAVEDHCATDVGQASEGGEHARGGLVVEEHEAGGSVIGDQAGGHARVAFERERADHQAAKRDGDCQ